MNALPISTNYNLQPENSSGQSFSEYYYAKEIIAGRIRGELAIHQTEIKTEECIINALGIFFKPSHSRTEIPLGLVAAPIRISPNLEKVNSLQKMKILLKILYRIQVLNNLDRNSCKNRQNRVNIAETSSFPRVKAVMHDENGFIHFQTGYPADTLADFIELLSRISEEEISLLEKRFLLLSVFKKIFVMLDNLPRKSHGDFHPKNILVSVQHEEPKVNVDQLMYTPPDVKTYVIDIGSLRNTIAPNLKKGKLFYTKQDDLQNLFTHLEQWWSLHLNKLLGITKLTRERVVQMLAQQEEKIQQRLLPDTVQAYQLQRLRHLLTKNSSFDTHYTKGELQNFSEHLSRIYEIDEGGEGAPTVIMPYTPLATLLTKQ